MDTPSDRKPPYNIVLGGFMGTGKSTVGRITAQRLGWTYIDSDARIASREKLTIPQIFAQHGEAYFRRLERELAPELAALSQVVIATGGGMLVEPANLDAFVQRGLVICLTASPEAIQARIGRDEAGRPLLRGGWRALLESRRVAYDRIPHQIDTTGKPLEQVVNEVLALWQFEST